MPRFIALLESYPPDVTLNTLSTQYPLSGKSFSIKYYVFYLGQGQWIATDGFSISCRSTQFQYIHHIFKPFDNTGENTNFSASKLHNRLKLTSKWVYKRDA